MILEISKERFDDLIDLKLKIYSLFLSAFSMLIGGLIYLLARPSEAVAIKYLIEVLPFLSVIREITVSLSYPDWFLYNLSDLLWSYSYSMVVLGLWIEEKTLESFLWICTIPVLTIGYEASQHWSFIPGTFDFLDLEFISLGIFFSLITIKILRSVLDE